MTENFLMLLEKNKPVKFFIGLEVTGASVKFFCQMFEDSVSSKFIPVQIYTKRYYKTKYGKSYRIVTTCIEIAKFILSTQVLAVVIDTIEICSTMKI